MEKYFAHPFHSQNVERFVGMMGTRIEDGGR